MPLNLCASIDRQDLRHNASHLLGEDMVNVLNGERICSGTPGHDEVCVRLLSPFDKDSGYIERRLTDIVAEAFPETSN